MYKRLSKYFQLVSITLGKGSFPTEVQLTDAFLHLWAAVKLAMIRLNYYNFGFSQLNSIGVC